MERSPITILRFCLIVREAEEALRMARHVNWLPPVEQRPDRYAGQSRRLIVEQLESRNLLASASDPAQDPEEDPEFGDAFIVSHYIDIHGPGRVPLGVHGRGLTRVQGVMEELERCHVTCVQVGQSSQALDLIRHYFLADSTGSQVSQLTMFCF